MGIFRTRAKVDFLTDASGRWYAEVEVPKGRGEVVALYVTPPADTFAEAVALAVERVEKELGRGS